jgi:hypothetical protein
MQPDFVSKLIGISLAIDCYDGISHSLMRSEINNFYYQLAQVRELSIVFVAFRHIQCCRWPHQNRTKEHESRELTIRRFSITPIFGNTMLVFVSITINRVSINHIDTWNLSLNTFPGFISKEPGLRRIKVLRKDST